MTSFTQDAAEKMVQNFETLLEELHLFRAVHGNHGPAPTSPATTKAATSADPEGTMTAYSQGMVLLEVAEDQAVAFIRAVAEPALSFAAWTSVRAVLESSALASWLLSPNINAQDRLRRSLAFRYEGLDQQLKFLKAIGRDAEHSNLEQRIVGIEAHAVSLGFPPLRGGKNNQRRLGIGQVMPSATEVIRDELGEDKNYRLLSAIAHGHIWALSQLGMRALEEQSTSSWNSIHASNTALEKHLRPEGVGYLCVTTATVFTKALWRASVLFGWDTSQLASTLEKNYDRLNFKAVTRHWKP